MNKREGNPKPCHHLLPAFPTLFQQLSVLAVASLRFCAAVAVFFRSCHRIIRLLESLS